MQLETGYRFCMAPRFANGLAWNERLQVDDGMTRAEPGLPPERSWHPASESERSVLVASETSADAWRKDVCLFAIPEHLRAKWWQMAARQVEKLPAGLDGMEPFARAIADFAQFKGVPLPPQCAFEVTLTSPADPPGSTSAGAIEATTAGDVLQRSRRAGAVAPSAPVIARVNLGDERTALIFLNLRGSRITEMVNDQRESRKAAIATEEGDPVCSFLAHFPDYPLVRLFLDPGEGVWLPDADVIYADDRSGKQDIDVWLVLKDEGGRRKDE